MKLQEIVDTVSKNQLYSQVKKVPVSEERSLKINIGDDENDPNQDLITNERGQDIRNNKQTWIDIWKEAFFESGEE